MSSILSDDERRKIWTATLDGPVPITYWVCPGCHEQFLPTPDNISFHTSHSRSNISVTLFDVLFVEEEPEGGLRSMPKIEVSELQQYPPFVVADDIGKKLGATLAAVITSAHRTIASTGRNAVNIRLGGPKGEERTLSLNKTNTRKLVEKLGNDSDKWVNETVTLVRSEANNPQTKKTVPAIRVE